MISYVEAAKHISTSSTVDEVFLGVLGKKVLWTQKTHTHTLLFYHSCEDPKGEGFDNNPKYSGLSVTGIRPGFLAEGSWPDDPGNGQTAVLH